MANTYTQIYIQVVFAVQGRYNLICKENKEELHKYITGIIRKKKQKLIAINSMPDHIHIFIGTKPSIHYPISFAISKTIHRHSLMVKNGYGENSIGRKDLARSRMGIHKSMRL